MHVTLNTYATAFQKINHFFTFETLNISSSNKTLHSTNQHCSEHRISPLRSACALLWQQRKALFSIYFKHEQVLDFPKSSHIYLPGLHHTGGGDAVHHVKVASITDGL